MANDDVAKKCLLGVGSGTLGMVIDDTGSMGPEISQVKAQVAQIVNRVIGTDDVPKQYLLVRFGDPDVGPPFETFDASAFLGAVNALSPSGGGDCPELANTALLQAVSRAKRGSSFYLFTDASSNDGSLLQAVIATALASARGHRLAPPNRLMGARIATTRREQTIPAAAPATPTRGGKSLGGRSAVSPARSARPATKPRANQTAVHRHTRAGTVRGRMFAKLRRQPNTRPTLSPGSGPRGTPRPRHRTATV